MCAANVLVVHSKSTVDSNIDLLQAKECNESHLGHTHTCQAQPVRKH